MSFNGRHLYRFGDFDLSIEESVLRRKSLPVSLTPKMFEVLLVLVRNHGRIVAKDELMKTVWADSFVEESNLTVTINQLRKVLGDDARKPVYIETVARRGYRFVPEVSSLDSTTTPEEHEGRALLPARQKPGWAGIGLLCFLGVSLILIIGWFAGRLLVAGRPPSILSSKFASQKITSSGNVRVAALSPDGKFAAYVDQVGGRQSIWLRDIVAEENVQIVSPSNDIYFGMTFSHSGDSLFFVRMPNEGHQVTTLYRVSTIGGVPVRILDNVVNFVSVSPDDKQISFVRCSYRQDDFCSLIVADVDGANERVLLARPPPLHIKVASFSPDGKSMAFASGNSWNGSSDVQLFQIDIQSAAEREIAPRGFFDIKSLGWLPDGDELIFTAKEFLDGKTSIWKASLATGECSRLADDPNSYHMVSLPRNADRMISTQVSNTYRLFFSGPNGEKALAAARDFAFAPSGKIIYASDDRNIWEISPDGSGQRQLTTDTATDYSPQVSPDGKFIYFTSNRTGENQVWRMNADGAAQVQITKNEGGYPRLVTTDGKWVIYLSGKNERLWKVSTETGEEIRLSEKFLMKPKISPNGELVAYFFRDKVFKIGVMRLSDHKTVRTLDYGDGTSRIFVLSWHADSRTINFVTDKDEKTTLWQQRIDENSPHFVANLGGEDIENLSAAPDNKNFAFTRGSWQYDAVLITGLE